MPTIRRATPSDAATLTTFARDIFIETFGPDNRQEDLDAYFAIAFSPDIQEREIRDTNGIVLLVEHEGALAGYAHLLRGTEEGVVAERPVELKRFYIAKQLQGKGAAHQLMERVFDEARGMGADVVWLGVWQSNGRAIAYYTREGFRRVGEHESLLGSDLQMDWIMARPVASVP